MLHLGSDVTFMSELNYYKSSAQKFFVRKLENYVWLGNCASILVMLDGLWKWTWDWTLTCCVVNDVSWQGLVLVIDNKLIMDHVGLTWSMNWIKSFLTDFVQSQIVIMTFNYFGLSQNDFTKQNFVAAFCVVKLGTFRWVWWKVDAIAKHVRWLFFWNPETFFWYIFNSFFAGSMELEICERAEAFLFGLFKFLFQNLVQNLFNFGDFWMPVVHCGSCLQNHFLNFREFSRVLWYLLQAEILGHCILFGRSPSFLMIYFEQHSELILLFFAHIWNRGFIKDELGQVTFH